MKIIVVFLTLILITDNHPAEKKLLVTERVKALKIAHGLYVDRDDSVMTYKNEEYVILTKEQFDDRGKICGAIVKGDLEYTNYSKQSLVAMKGIMKGFSLSESINASITDSRHVRLNGRTYVILLMDKAQHIVYYDGGKSDDIIFRIKYR